MPFSGMYRLHLQGRKILTRLWPATCSPISTDPTPLLSIDFPCFPLSLSSCSYVAACFRLAAQSAANCSRRFLSRGCFYPEDVGNKFLRNVGSHKNYKAPHPRGRHSSPSVYISSLIYKPKLHNHRQSRTFYSVSRNEM
jgi:hypothetical protein